MEVHVVSYARYVTALKNPPARTILRTDVPLSVTSRPAEGSSARLGFDPHRRFPRVPDLEIWPPLPFAVLGQPLPVLHRAALAARLLQHQDRNHAEEKRPGSPARPESRPLPAERLGLHPLRSRD